MRSRLARKASALLWLGCALFAATLEYRAAAASEAPRAVHGSADIFAAPEVTLAWGVLRGATEAETLVVVRVAVNREAFGSMSVIGIDPFAQGKRSVLPPTTLGAGIDVRVPRAQFADFPRTEFRFFASASPAPSDPPQLVVFYLGIPDTTPELPSQSALEAYLAARVARARDGAGKKTP